MSRSRTITFLVVALSTLTVGNAVFALTQAYPNNIKKVAFGGANTGITIITSSGKDRDTTSTKTFTQLRDMWAQVPTTANQTLLDIRFSARTSCWDEGGGPQQHPGNTCLIQVKVDNTVALPVDCPPPNGNGSMLAAFDSTNLGDKHGAAAEETWQAHAIERFVVVPPGTHSIFINGRVTDWATDPGVTPGLQYFETADRVLVVEQHPLQSLTTEAGCSTGATG